MPETVTNPEYRCTCQNPANCTWGWHGFIPDMQPAPVTAERLALYAEYEAITTNLPSLPPEERREALIRQGEVFSTLLHG